MSIRTNLCAAGLGGLLALGACGGGDVATDAATDAAVETPSDAGGAAYAELVGAVEEAKVPLCPTAEGGTFIPLPAPSTAAARDFSYFRYLEGRIYEVGPCQLEEGRRNELRIYRYPDEATRDAAIRDVSVRQTRPTSTFAYGDVHALEIWSPEPALDSPVGQAAATVHSAIAEVPGARHLDVAGS